MDLADSSSEEHQEAPQSPRKLPDDLPRSLDDRRNPVFGEETEIWDGWKGVTALTSARLDMYGFLTLCQVNLNSSPIWCPREVRSTCP